MANLVLSKFPEGI